MKNQYNKDQQGSEPSGSIEKAALTRVRLFHVQGQRQDALLSWLRDDG